LEKQKEAHAKEVSEKALEMIENIEKEVVAYKDTISQKKLTIQCPYERAKNVYNQANQMFLEIGWMDQADKLTDSIKLYGDLAIQDKKWRDSEKLKEEQRIREENELKTQIEREKEQIEKERNDERKNRERKMKKLNE
jgi:hypothetical protein